MSTSEIATVLAWHDALSTADLDTLVSLSSDDIEIGDAGGAAQGHAALRDWAQRFAGPVEVGEIYYRDGVVVVEERRDAGTVASAFRVVHDHVTSAFRHDDLASALAATDMAEEDLQA
ncbi:ketosteroid isomerase-like protein [Mycolicibacterium sp. BK556]|uniref:nuclear transport factor 2 family protein n=1 Tax=Mycobacteriaceae TaxID=1762 RepID=UPI00105B76BC|nr:MULTISPECIES: nuclear transport factor 2 family protein [Mycobacteriaceae]MBB3604907.1 ketosteroid isomerase-like protein [Mycolicibacterium sp. BK556]MBB3635103.1 ketosteroid isomerase-like protein [Mycolicibacterium sp. BK607]MBB3748102.1 ketosteroid isomerase-like protein [Mycolicibacterium sp. BK634]TDO07766.1 SnoaL-like protein [Mycobacterium sp. BK086]